MAIRSEAYKSLELGASKDHAHALGTPLALLNLSSNWERSILKNEKLLVTTRNSDPVTIFHGSKAPKMSITQYMERILKYSRCSPSCFVIAQIYIDRFFQKRGGSLTSFNAHRLLITSVMLATKFLDDKYYSNAYYAKIGGVSTEEMNRMEIEFLFNLEFRLFVTTELFMKYCEKLDKTVELLKK
ncbi:cyclin-P3-1 [Cajanus cajan]|uniref:Cyclin n=1 Tax=Cajanus cajan TaxID=3821 RepID=A0A151TW39_CAJCA|nr:cyclin-P3-1 [Cajanus cajan]KYP71236.1 Cyclin-P3-1 [Cajanus cajan]